NPRQSIRSGQSVASGTLNDLTTCLNVVPVLPSSWSSSSFVIKSSATLSPVFQSLIVSRPVFSANLFHPPLASQPRQLNTPKCGSETPTPHCGVLTPWNGHCTMIHPFDDIFLSPRNKPNCATIISRLD